MKKKLTFLGIETSCDETAASIVQENDDGTANILSSVVSSQIREHEKFGGVVPELAARSHMENIDFIINRAIKDSNFKLEMIDGVAATAGPGLVVCLSIGFNIGKSIAGFNRKPFIAVNHLEGHALSAGLEKKIEFPYLLLLISGGHSQFLIVNGVNNYKQLGTTIDDAVGEAFDKTAKILGLSYPGGPALEKFANDGKKDFFKLPQPIINKGGCNLSFAGLKTAVLRESKKLDGKLDLKKNLAASFQNTVNNILTKKTLVAMKQFKDFSKKKKSNFVIAGGVAANKTIRKNLEKIAIENDFDPMFPNPKFCGDNAAMIAWAGIKRFKLNLINDLNFKVKSRWALDAKAPFMKGPGIKL